MSAGLQRASLIQVMYLQTEQAAAQLLAAGFQQWDRPTSGTIVMELGAARNGPVAEKNAMSLLDMQQGAVQSHTPTSSVLPQASPPAPAPSRSRGRSSRGPVSAADTSLHPVVRLGWRPLCSVVCNGLRGEFLGGHDRDMFIQCTSAHYVGLPLVDVALGGCIMTCSQFERVAGRELSKKWKESIHVVGEGEGSRATLLSWLKRRGERDFGDAVVGKRVWVCWCADAEYYQGTIISYSRDTGKHSVQYTSRLVEDLHLPVEIISFDAEKPQLAAAPQAAPVAASTPSPAATAPAGGAAVTLVDPPAAPTVDFTPHNPIWHQSSNVSVASCLVDELRQGGVGGRGLRAAGRRTRPLHRVLEDTDGGAPPPKRTVSAPAAAILAEVAAAAQALAEEAHGTASPLTPGMVQPHHAKSFAASPVRMEATVMPVPAPPLPSSPPNPAAAVAWMHRVALTLDGDLVEAAMSAQLNSPMSQTSEQSSHGGRPGPSGCPGPDASMTSVSGRFQALVVLLQAQPACLQGLYDALVLRYNHFQYDAAVQRQKLVEFVMATVHEAGVQRMMPGRLPQLLPGGEGAPTQLAV